MMPSEYQVSRNSGLLSGHCCAYTVADDSPAASPDEAPVARKCVGANWWNATVNAAPIGNANMKIANGQICQLEPSHRSDQSSRSICDASMTQNTVSAATGTSISQMLRCGADSGCVNASMPMMAIIKAIDVG